MIALFTTDAWSTISIDFNDGGGAQTYTPSPATIDAYSLAEDLIDWLNTTYPGDSWSWSWARDTTTGGATLTYTATTNTYNITANGGAQDVLGVSASYTGVSTMSGVAESTVAPLGPWSVTLWYASSAGGGVGSGAGAVRVGCPGTAPIAPNLQCVMAPVDLARWTSQAASMSTRRRAYVYDLGADAWRLVSVGRADASRSLVDRWRMSVEVHG